MNETKAATGIAEAETQHQMSRRLARGLRFDLTEAQQQVVRALIYNAALYAIEAWEKGRPAREAAAFYEGKSNTITP